MRSTKTNLLMIGGAIAGCIFAGPRTTLAQKPGATRPAANAPAQKAPAESAPALIRQRELVFTAGESVLSAGLALGGINGAVGEGDSPPVFAAFDFGIGPDFSVGGVASYYKSSLSTGYSLATYTTSYTYKTVGVRADYHFGKYLPVEKLDLYGGLLIAYGMVSVSSQTSSPHGGSAGSGGSANLTIWGVNVGARYFFSNALAAQVEAGVGLGNLSLGIAYKL